MKIYILIIHDQPQKYILNLKEPIIKFLLGIGKQLHGIVYRVILEA